MKVVYIPVGLLAVILAFSLWTGRYVELRTEEWTAILEQAEDAAQREQWAEAEAILDSAYKNWDSSQTFFHTIMKHEELDDAESLFTGALAACRERDNEDFHILLSQLAKQLELLAETQAISIKNVL